MGEGRARAPPHTRTSLCDLLCDCPTGKSLKTCPALAQKIFRFAFTPNHSYNSRHPAPTRGAYRDRHGRWVRGAVAAARRARNTSSQGELAHERRRRRTAQTFRFRQSSTGRYQARRILSAKTGRGRQSRVVLAPVAGVKPAEVLRNPTGFAKAFNPPVTEAKGIRLRGELGISRKTIAQGMPGCSGCTCMLVCVSLAHIAHETAGASRHPAFPAPSY